MPRLREETLGSAGSGDLVRRLVGLEDRPWADWIGGRPITQARVARLLRSFGIHPLSSKTLRGFCLLSIRVKS